MFSKIYPIINVRSDGNFDEKLLKKCLELDPIYLQVRMKDATVSDICRVTEKIILQRNLLNSKAKIIVNDSVGAAVLSGADGVHLGQTDDIRHGLSMRKNGFIVGYSTHTIDEVVKANDLPVDYIGFGPVFKTGTKIQEYAEVFELTSEAFNKSEHPLVFIGGINKINIESLPAGDRILYAMVSGLDEIVKEVGNAE